MLFSRQEQSRGTSLVAVGVPPVIIENVQVLSISLRQFISANVYITFCQVR